MLKYNVKCSIKFKYHNVSGKPRVLVRAAFCAARNEACLGTQRVGHYIFVMVTRNFVQLGLMVVQPRPLRV